MYLSNCSGLVFGQDTQNIKNTTAEQVIATIIKKTGSPLIPKTVDVIKEGEPQTTVI